jgi:uridylate kinase
MTHRQLAAVAGGARHRPGMSAVMDPLAVRTLARRRIPAAVVDGRDPRNIARAVAGEPVGTRVGQPPHPAKR